MYAEVNGTKLYYDTLGEGVGVFFLHGGLGFDHTLFRPWCDPLSEKFCVVYYDHRGNGRSDGRDSLANVDHSTWTDDLDALREYLGFDTFVLVGHSYGGILGQEYALRYQDRLKGLVLAVTMPAWDSGYRDMVLANARARGTSEQIAAAETMWTPVADADEFAELGRKILPLYFKRYDPEIGKKMADEGYPSYQAYNRGFIECLRDWSVVERLGEINTKTLVIAGADDWIAPVEQAERIHERLPNSELVVFEESGHSLHIEEQERYLEVVGNWITNLK